MHSTVCTVQYTFGWVASRTFIQEIVVRTTDRPSKFPARSTNEIRAGRVQLGAR